MHWTYDANGALGEIVYKDAAGRQVVPRAQQ
jgi:hypothetical protein